MCTASVRAESNTAMAPSPAKFGIWAMEPAVKMSAATSPTHRPSASITPPRIPGTAEGSTQRNTVRKRPAPKPNPPSRYASGTASSASSVVRMTTGSTMMASVQAPAKSDRFQCSAVTKNSMPNRP